MPKPITKPKAKPQRPAPVSLAPLTLEQALGALLRTPDPSATKDDDGDADDRHERRR